jgi:hypothetical protein
MKKSKVIAAIAPTDEGAAYAASVVTVPANAITRADDKVGTISVSDAGLAFIRARASEGASQTLIACELGIGSTTLKSTMKRDEKVRVAWEHGRAELEQEFVSLLIASARKGNFVPILFGLKALFGVVEGAAPPATAPNITIVLPDSYSPEAYMRTINEPRAKVTRPVLPSPAPSGNTEVTR